MCPATHAHLMPNIQVEGENPTQVRCSKKPGKPALYKNKKVLFLSQFCEHWAWEFSLPSVGIQGPYSPQPSAASAARAGQQAVVFPLSQFVLPSPPHEGSTQEWLGFRADFSCGWVVQQLLHVLFHASQLAHLLISAGWPRQLSLPTRYGWPRQLSSSTSASWRAKLSITGCFVFQAGWKAAWGVFQAKHNQPRKGIWIWTLQAEWVEACYGSFIVPLGVAGGGAWGCPFARCHRILTPMKQKIVG